ncbi:ribonuclease III domain-containing protein [Trametes meyenii]|nr:ribonuclease III domain-containing protein [Trametes meyenii]
MVHYYSALQQSINKVINHPDFNAALPPLSDQTWMKILTYSPQAHQENERLEFVGDALMYATIGRQLYEQIPDGSPHLYTNVRAALHSNRTFAMLAEKLDIMAVSNSVLKALTRKTFGEGVSTTSKTKPQIKATADLFETVIGAYYMDHGFEMLYQWVRDIYTPLIKAAADTFHWCRSHKGGKHRCQDPRTFKIHWDSEAQELSPAPARKAVALTPVQQRKRALEKIKAAHAARRSPSAKASVLGRANLPAKPKLLPSVIRSKTPSLRRSVLQLAASASKTTSQAAPAVKKAPIFIDLTIDTDSGSEAEEGAIVFRHPLVTPRIHHPSPAMSKRPTPARAPGPATGTTSGSNSESEDETMLENMLTADTSFSDMDCDSSDVESPARPSNLAPHLTRPFIPGGVQAPLILPRRNIFFK